MPLSKQAATTGAAAKPPAAYWGFGPLRTWLFRADAEVAHDRVQRWLEMIGYLPPLLWVLRLIFAPWFWQRRCLQQHLMGLNFPAPVGLPAGFDKNGRLLRTLPSLGFGFIEVGTITPKAQPGNPLPRMWRDQGAGALVNALGFNNEGVDKLAARLQRCKHHAVPIGVNIGKNRDTDVEEALSDYQKCLDQTYAHADYIVINVSSPNTPGLRDLQNPFYLLPLLQGISAHANRLAVLHGVTRRPLLVKLAPELTDSELQSIVQVIKQAELQGVVATNTLKTDKGGKSGQPLFEHSLRMVQALRQQLGKDFVIIGVGGISSPAEALQMLRAGADLLQVYTGWVYRGPGLIPKLHNALYKTVNDSNTPSLRDYLQSVARSS